jgi:RNA polymerase sigma-70 factor (ECF subfamily)
MNPMLTDESERTEPVAFEPHDLDMERYRHELTAYCYRMLGSTFEADDAVQNTMLRAWRSAGRFAGRSSVRSWLYRIATNVCFDLLKARGRRAMPMDVGPSSPGDGSGELAATDVLWLQPIPDDAIAPAGRSAADVVVARESVRLAFVAALQFLPARQRAVLILRDVLGWQATEVAELLGMSSIAVHSALRRARETIGASDAAASAANATLESDQERLLARYVDAFERFDIDALVSLLRDDAVMSMPPRALWLQGAETIRAWWTDNVGGCRYMRVVPTSANGGPAFALYKPESDGTFEAFGIQVVEVVDDGIAALHSFIEADLVARFGLPTLL